MRKKRNKQTDANEFTRIKKHHKQTIKQKGQGKPWEIHRHGSHTYSYIDLPYEARERINHINIKATIRNADKRAGQTTIKTRMAINKGINKAASGKYNTYTSTRRICLFVARLPAEMDRTHTHTTHEHKQIDVQRWQTAPLATAANQI